MSKRKKHPAPTTVPPDDFNTWKRNLSSGHFFSGGTMGVVLIAFASFVAICFGSLVGYWVYDHFKPLQMRKILIVIFCLPALLFGWVAFEVFAPLAYRLRKRTSEQSKQ